MFDAIGEIRGHMMEKARDTVRSHYTFSGGHGEYVQKLLQNKAFLSVDINHVSLQWMLRAYANLITAKATKAFLKRCGIQDNRSAIFFQ